MLIPIPNCTTRSTRWHPAIRSIRRISIREQLLALLLDFPRGRCLRLVQTPFLLRAFLLSLSERLKRSRMNIPYWYSYWESVLPFIVKVDVTYYVSMDDARNRLERLLNFPIYFRKIVIPLPSHFAQSNIASITIFVHVRTATL